MESQQHTESPTRQELSRLWDLNRSVPKTIHECMHTRISQIALQQPAEKLAVDAWDGRLTYRQLERLSDQLAAQLGGLGVGQDVVVPLCFEKSMYTVVAIMGVLKAGGAFVLLDVNQPKERLQGIMRQCRPKVICTSARSSHLCPSDTPTLLVQSKVEETPAAKSAPAAQGEICSSSWPMYICFTSGSTGKPKGVVVSHAAFSSARCHQNDAFRFHSEARVLDFASYAFDVAVYNVMMTLSIGATLCIPSEEQRKGALNETLRDMKVTTVALTPSTSRLLNLEDVANLETLILSGEAVTEQDLERLSKGSFNVLHAYGPAECTPMSTLNASPVAPAISTHMGTGIGAVTWITDPADQNKLMPPGMAGELLLEGPILANGYLGQPEETKASFIHDPPWLLNGFDNCPGRRGRLYKTGDIVSYDQTGNLEFKGRKDLQVKIRGQRFELAEVEHHARLAMPLATGIVAEVIQLGGDENRDTLTVFVTGNGPWSNGTRISEGAELLTIAKEVDEKLSNALPVFMVPSLYIQLADMPLSVTGKADRGYLRRMGYRLSPRRLAQLRRRCPGTTMMEPRNNTESLLRGAWAEVLGLDSDDLSTEEEFIALGGDSIAAIKLVGVARRVGISLTAADVFQYPTVTQQAQIQAEKSALREQNMILPFELIKEDPGYLASLCTSGTAPIEDAYPCTQLQEGMFALSATRVGDYMMQATLKFSPCVDIATFKRAWEDVFRSTATLRTRIVQTQMSGLVQAVFREDIEWIYAHDLRTYLEHDRLAPMGLGDRLVRFALVGAQNGSPTHFVWTFHHALYDGWSLQLVSNLVNDVFRGIIEDAEELTGFSSFVRHVFQKDEEEMERYWKKYLDPDSELVTFPSLPMTIVRPVANASLTMELSPETRTGLTQSTMIRGALGILLGHHTASQDVVFGAISAGRNTPVIGIEDVRGPTIATVPVRVQIDPDQSIMKYLQGLQREATEMTPFEQVGLQRLAKMGPSARNACEFQTLLVVQPQEEELPSDDVLGHWTTSTTEQGFTTYAVTLECLTTSDGGLKVKASYDPRIMDEWKMTRMLHQLNLVLQQLATNPSSCKVADVQILTEEDTEIIRSWNNVEPKVDRRCIHDLIGEHTTATPDAPAIKSWDGQATYRELDQMSSHMATWLIEAGVGPEVVVPLCFEKSMYTVVSILAVFKAGGAFVLLDPGSPHSRLRKLCEQVYAKVAITSPACKSRLADFVPSILSVDDTFFARCGKLSPFMNPRAEPSNAAYIIFTSGSTGEPKGVIIEHQSYCSAVVSHREMNMSSSMRALQFGSYNFAGSIIEILMTLIHGGCICVPSEQGRGEDLANEIRRLNANWTFMTSTVLANLHPDQVPCLKTICVGGEPIRSVQIEQWASQVSLRQTYGSAELSGVVGSGRLDLNSQVTDVGKAVSAKIWLADARDINRLSPLGVPGEIIIEGPTVGREYIGQPEKTAAAFIKAPKWREAFGTVASTSRFYKTGDLAVYTSEGAVQLLGRKDTQVKLRGQRIEVGEVEQQARLATSEIQEVVVELTTFTGASRGPELVGFIVFRKQTNEKSIGRVLRLIQSRLEGALPHYMVPSLLVPIEELPLTASRKTDRRKLREMGALLSTDRVEKLRKLMAGEKREPSTPVEQKLLRSWAEALGIPSQPGIGVDDSFFRLGGDSIAAIRLTVLARKSGILLSVADIFRNPTLVAQARVARQATGESIDNLVPFSLLVDDYGGTSAQLRSELALLCGINESVVLNAFPMTPIQEGLLSLTAKRDGDYVMQAILELPKSTNIEAFKRAWEAVVGASEALQARAAQHGQLGLVQVVCDDGIQWRQAANLERYLSLDKRDAMELGSSLSRYALIGQDEKHASHFVWTIHHALFDAWSITHILDSVHEAYQSGNAPRPTVPFANFVRYVSNVPSDESVSFWRTYLEGAELAPFPALPFWVQEPAADATLRVNLCANLKTEGVTSSILIRGALAMLINQYSGSPDVLIGSTVSGRNAPVIGVEEIVGPTIATVPVRIQVAEDQPVAAFLQSVQKDATDMIAYEQMGLQRIARMSEDGRKACGFQTLLVIHTSDDKLQQEDDARLGKWHAEEDHNRGFSTYGVILEVYLKNSGPTTIKATYDTRVISTWKMNKLLQNLDTLLRRLEQPASASQTVKQVCAISEQDTLTITTWNKGMPDVNNSLVHATIHQRAVDRPDSPAVQSWDGSLTYTELDLLSNKLASYLSNLGVGPEVIVPILSEKSMWSIVSILGILKAGGAFVLLDPGQPRARLEKLCRQVRASTAVTSIPSKDGLFGIVSTSVAVGWELLDSLCESKAPVSTVRPDNVAYVIFTSGSTGEPKGVVVEHRSYVSGALNQGPLMGMSVKTRALQFGSYNFAGCIMEMLITMLNGGCVCIPSEEQRGTQLQQTIRDLDANWTFLTSTVLENMTPDEVPCIRTICVGGEPARAAQIKQWSAACHLRQTYGAAETGTVVSSAPLNTSSTTGDVGKATAGKYWIVNPTDFDMLMPVGAPGEVLIEGPTIAREYLDRPEKSATAFIKPPAWRHSFGPIHEASRFYMTGDLAAYKDDGSIQLMGRKDTQIKLRGQRIEAGEVEHHAVLASAAIKHAVVDLCLVSGGFEGRTKPQLVGFLVVETPAGQRADYSDLKHGAFDTEVQRVLQKVVARLENALPHYMVPSVLVPIPQLPLTTTGKTDRRRLREMGSSLSEQEIVALKNAMRSARRAPLKDRERRMQTIWASVLNLDLDQISMDDSFFRLGGDSIGAMKLVGMAHTMGMNLSVADVFRNPILAAQALIIDENKDETEIDRVESFSMLNMALEKARNELGSLCCVDPDQVEDAYPCTPLQEGLMYHTGQRAGDYTMQAVMQISHLVSLVSFKAAWEQVFAASPILRTRIVHHNSTSALIQVVCREHEPWIQVSGDLEDYMAKDQVVSMELGAPLSRSAIVQQDDGSMYFVWTLHHALYDGWSFPLLSEMAVDAYQGKPMVQRTEFNAFVEQVLREQEDEKTKSYWQSYLAHEDYAVYPPVPTCPKAPNPTERLEHMVPLGRNNGATVSTMLRAAMGLVLGQYAGFSPGVMFGATVSGRNASVAGLDRVVGPTIATVPVCVQVDPESTVWTLFDTLQSQAAEMMAYEQTGLQRIAKMDDNCRHACSFQTLLVVQPEEEQQTNTCLGEWKTLLDQEGFITYPLVMECIPQGDKIKLLASYDGSIIEEWKMRNITKQLSSVLQQLIDAGPEKVVRDIQILTPKDEGDIYNLTKQVPESVQTTVQDLISSQVSRQPEALAISAWDGDLSYAELSRLASRLAQQLVRQGLTATRSQEDTIVPMCFDKSKWAVIAMLAVLEAGATFLMIDPEVAIERREAMMELVGAGFTLCSPERQHLMSRPGRTVITVCEDSLLALPPAASTCKISPASLDSGAYVVFTSGSTGTPKGIMISHQALSTSTVYSGERFGIRSGTRMLQFASFAFDAFVMEILAVLVHGGCVVIPSTEERDGDVGKVILDRQINSAILTPSVARLLSPASVRALDSVILCGETPTTHDIQHLSPVPRLLNGYGPAECTVCCAVADVQKDGPVARIGTSVGCVAWVVAPSNHDRLVVPGAVGELLIEGPILAKEYVGNPEGTAAAFITSPAWSSNRRRPSARFYKTGDLVRMDLNGEMVYIGRKDTQVKIRGQRLELGDVEHNLAESLRSSVDVVADMVLLDGHSKPVLAAFMAGLTADDAQTTIATRTDQLRLVKLKAEIGILLRRIMPSYMIPTIYFVLNKIPLSASGKADRRSLQSMAARVSADEVANVNNVNDEKRQGGTDEEKILQGIWAKCLRVPIESVGMDDTFIQLGGDSITAMMVVAEARRLGFQIGVADVLRATALRTLSSRSSRNDLIKQEDIPQSDVEGLVDQSYAQGRLWFLDQLYPNSTMYLMPFAVRLRGILNVKALETALLAIEARHETLRTTFTADDNRDLQLVHPLRARALVLEDMTGDELSFYKSLRQEQKTPFDLRKDMGWRLKIYRITEQDHVLSIVMHHIVSDGWSVSVLQSELATFYAAAIRGQDPFSTVHPLPIQYKDYALWQRHQEQKDEHTRQLGYWTEQLRDSRPAEFICDKARPIALSGQAEVTGINIEGSIYSSLQSFCKQRGVTPFSVLLAAFRATHFRLTGSKDATIGTANANRSKWQVKDMIGFFVNMQCLRIHVDGSEETFEQLVRSVQATASASLENQDVPFEQIVAKLKKDQDRDLARQPLVQVVFTLHAHTDLGQFTLEGLEAEPMHLATTSRFDLEFHFTQGNDNFKGELAFSTDLYERRTIDNMLSVFLAVLDQGLANPQTPVSNMSLSTETCLAPLEAFDLLDVEKTLYERDLSIPGVFQKIAARHPHRVAVQDASGCLTYAELDIRSDRLARWLCCQEGYESEKLIGVYAPRSCQTLVAYLGILKANLAYIPLDINSPITRIELILSTVEAPRMVLLGPGTMPPPVAMIVNFARINQVSVATDTNTGSIARRWPTASSLAYVMFTSGSTGKPKGVMVEHRGVIRTTTENNLVKHFPANPKTAHIGNTGFDITTWEIYSTVLNGGTLVCIDSADVLDSGALANIFMAEKINNAILTPALLRQCLQESPAFLTHLELLLVGGDKADAQALRTAQQIMSSNATIVNAYGPTENTIISTFYALPKHEAFTNDEVPIGRALSNSGAYVVDASLQLLPIGAIGELVVTGDGLARGYTDSLLETDNFVTLEIRGTPQRAYRTGDFVRYRPSDGQMEFIGRMDGQVKVRGHRIEVAEIESVLKAHSSVSDAIVVPRKRGEQHTQLAGFITISTDAADNEGLVEGLESNNDADEHVKLWEDLFDSEKYTGVEDETMRSVGRDFTSWTSMYDGQPLDTSEMNEWLDDTIAGILNGGNPGKVLEIGTGTGMVLFNIVDGLENYVGLEPTATAIDFVTKAARSIPGLSEKVYMHKGPATDINRVACHINSPDLVVINSVAQYFPSQAYLRRLIQDLVSIRGVKTIHFGDMRSWALYDEFTAAKALHNLEGCATKEQVMRRMADTAEVETELLVDPGFFTSLIDELPEHLHHVEIIPKKMKATNELSCYRYAAVLHLKGREGLAVHRIPDGEWTDYTAGKLDRMKLLELLRSQKGTVAVTNVPHRKTAVETVIVDDIRQNPSTQLKDRSWLTALQDGSQALSALSTLDLEDLAVQTGRDVSVSWARQFSLRGGFDVIFHDKNPTDGRRSLFNFPTDHAMASRQLASKPLHQRMTQRVQAELQQRLRETLPDYMVPSSVLVLKKIPVTENGKVDRKALAASVPETATPRDTKHQTMSTLEAQLQDIWGKVLYIEPATIALQDSFFQLGGDSIMAMKVVTHARKSGIALAVADIFKHPVLADLAASRHAEAPLAHDTDTSTVPPFSLLEDQGATLREELAALCGLETIGAVLDAYPCTPLQEGLISLTTKREGDYVMQALFKIDPRVNLAKFKSSWAKIVALSSILRTRIVLHHRLGLVQVVCDEEMHWADVGDLDAYLLKDKAMPTDLSGPLSRFALATKNQDTYLVWTVHHSLYDGWSLSHVMQLVHDAYHDKSMDASLPEFNLFVKHILQSNKTDQEIYWRSRLSDNESRPFPEMPFGIRDPVNSTALESTFTLPSYKNSEITTPTRIRAALALIIGRYQNAADVVFGSVVSGRNAPLDGIEHIVGPTIASVPVRTKIDNKQPVLEYLKTLQREASDAIDYEQCGLQNIAGLSDDARRACEFQTLLVVQPQNEDDPSDRPKLGSWEASTTQKSLGGTYAVVLECFLGTQETTVRASIDERIITQSQMKRLIQQIGVVLNQFDDSETKVVGDIDILCDEDKQVLAGMHSFVPEGMQACLHNLVSQRAKTQPKAQAVCGWDGSLTYSELDEFSDRLAGHLFLAGCHPNSIVPVCADKSIWVVVAALAVLKAGSGFLLLDSSLPSRRRDQIIGESNTDIVLSSPQIAGSLSSTEYKIITFGPEMILSLVKSSGRSAYHDPESLAFVVFTSGSTGNPKGILISHQNICTSASYHGNKMGFNEQTRTLQFCSFAFDASVMEIFTTLLFGGTVCVPTETERLSALESCITAYDVNLAFFTPTVARLLKPERLPSLSTVILGGEPASNEDMRRWGPAVAVYNIFAPAECTIVVAIGTLDCHQGVSGSHVGHQTGAVIWVVSPDDADRLVPVGAVGELYIEGPLVSSGYLNSPDQTRAAFIDSPRWLRDAGRKGVVYKCGDLGRMNEDGTFTHLGRLDAQVKLNGQRMELSEVEMHLRECISSTAEIAAELIKLDHHDGQGRPILAGFVGAKDACPEMRATKEVCGRLHLAWLQPETTKKLTKRLPAYMVPAVFFQMDRLPVSTSGKLDRNKLRLAVTAALSAQDYAEIQSAANQSILRSPRTETEKTLRQLLAQVLNITEEVIGMDDNFISLGCDSIAAMKFVALARQANLPFNVADVFKLSSIADLAAATSHRTPNDPISAPVEPFSLVSQDVREIATKAVTSSQTEQIRDIWPTTGFQRDVIKMSMERPEQSLNYVFLDLGKDVYPKQLKLSCQRLFDLYSILQSIFVTVRDEPFLVGLEQATLPFQVIDVAEDLITASHDICVRDQRHGLMLGHVPTFFMVVRHATQGTRLILRLSHAQYDGVSLPILLGTLLDMYHGRECLRSHEFTVYLRHKQAQKHVSFEYWRQLLQGTSITQLSHILRTSNVSGTEGTLSAEKIVVEEEVSFTKRSGSATLATTLSAAWAIVLSHATGLSEVVYGTLVTGRDDALPGVESIVGPCVEIVPAKAKLSAAQPATELLASIQEQSFASQTHAMGIQEVTEFCTDWPNTSDFESVFQHQGVDENPELRTPDGPVKVSWFEDPTLLPPRLLVMTYPTEEGVRLRLLSNTHLTSPGAANKLLDNLAKVFIAMVTAEDKAVSIGALTDSCSPI